MKYLKPEEALKELRVFTPEQVVSSLFKAGDEVTIKNGEQFILVDTDEEGKNNTVGVKITIKRDGEEFDRTITLRTLFGTIRTDIPQDLEENVDTILPYAKAKYESRFICPFNVAESIKLGHTTQEWTFKVVEIPALVNQFVDRNNKEIKVHEDLLKKTLNGQKFLNGLYRLRKVTCSERKK